MANDAMEEAVLADIDLPDAEVLRQVDSLIDWDKEQEQSSSWWSSWMPGNADELQQGRQAPALTVRWAQRGALLRKAQAHLTRGG